MCNPDTNIRFCTCSKTIEVQLDYPDEVMRLYNMKLSDAYGVLDDKEAYHSTYYKWTLYTFKPRKVATIGELTRPFVALNETLTKNQVLEALNSHPFDFEYVPKEQDALIIQEEYRYIQFKDEIRPPLRQYMYFEYTRGAWEFQYDYPPYGQLDRIKIGKIKED